MTLRTPASTGAIESAYRGRTPGSAAIGVRAEAVMPAGDTRAAGYHAPYPLTLVRGEGARVWDVDGNVYWDLNGNYSSLVHGYGYPPILEAATKAMHDGTAWAARNPHQVELAEILCARVASIDQVRFCNSGTEAGLLAQVAARIITGRPRILMARHGYHGSHELFETGFFAGLLHVPGADATLVAEYGDAAAFEAILAEHGGTIAAVFLEGVMGSAGIIDAPAEFFHRVQAAARAAGSMFVLDEVITLRLAPGGRQSVIGLEPDLTMLGKLIGGGFPVGAVGGRAEVMAVMDPRQRRMFHSGTFNGNPVTMAAGVASLQGLTPDRIDTLDELGARLEAGLGSAARAAGLPFSTRRVGSLLNVYFTDSAPGANLVREDDDAMKAFHLAALTHGLFFASRGMLVLSTAMTPRVIDEVLEKAALAMIAVAAEVDPT